MKTGKKKYENRSQVLHDCSDGSIGEFGDGARHLLDGAAAEVEDQGEADEAEDEEEDAHRVGTFHDVAIEARDGEHPAVAEGAVDHEGHVTALADASTDAVVALAHILAKFLKVFIFGESPFNIGQHERVVDADDYIFAAGEGGEGVLVRADRGHLLLEPGDGEVGADDGGDVAVAVEEGNGVGCDTGSVRFAAVDGIVWGCPSRLARGDNGLNPRILHNREASAAERFDIVVVVAVAVDDVFIPGGRAGDDDGKAVDEGALLDGVVADKVEGVEVVDLHLDMGGDGLSLDLEFGEGSFDVADGAMEHELGGAGGLLFDEARRGVCYDEEDGDDDGGDDEDDTPREPI